MKFITEKVKEEFNRDTYWTKITVISDDGKKNTVILTCVSSEYMWNAFKTQKINQELLDKWLENVVKKWQSLGDSIFESSIHRDVYANTRDGIENGYIFLNKEVLI